MSEGVFAAMHRPFLRARVAVAALALGTISCAPMAPTGGGPPGLSASERQQGVQAHQQIVQQFGGAMQGPLAQYVAGVGQRVARHSHPQVGAQDYRVTLLDTPVPNAFAVPGGYIYVTRGLLAVMNDEAELGAVLGHEVGHVAARHHAGRQQRQGVGQLASVLAGVLTGSEAIMQLGSAAAQSWVLSFSRQQEYEADDLGLRYITAEGYDPFAMPDLLGALERQRRLEQLDGLDQRQIPTWLSTHPTTADRIQRTRAAAQQTGVDAGQRPRNEGAFLSAIDGMVFGDAPEQGQIDGTRFRHGVIRLGFDAPRGFRLSNSPQQVTGNGPGGANFRFAGGRLQPGQSLEALVQQAWTQAAGQQVNAPASRTQVNGLETVVSRARLGGQRGQVDAGVTAYRWSDSEAYLFLTVAPAGQGQQFDPLLASMRRLSEAEAREALRARRIEVVAVRQGDTVESLARRMAFGDNQVERFRALNALDAGQSLRAGQRVKLIVQR